MINTIYLRRKNKVVLAEGTSKLEATYLAGLLKNIESLGYTLSPALIKTVATLSVEQAAVFYEQLINDLKRMLGAHVRYNPMYPNFPKQVMEASEAELYLNALLHYLGDVIGYRMLPAYEKEKRGPLQDSRRLKIIDLGTEAEFKKMFLGMMKAKTSIALTDKVHLDWYIHYYGDAMVAEIPDVVPLKENVAVIAASLLKHTSAGDQFLAKHIKTATDVLRVAVAMSDGDVSLAANTRFRNFSKKERRLLLYSLESCKSITEDMLRYQNRWKRLGERLHPFDYKKRYPKCFEAFDIIRNDHPFSTYNSKVEKGLEQKDLTNLVQLLRTRPGEMARRMDHLLRLTEDPSLVLTTFGEVAEKVSSPVLLQLMAHFKHRNKPQEIRAFFPKGEVSNVMAIPYELPSLSAEICQEVVRICCDALIERYKKLKPLGKVYLDEELKNFKVPFALRSASKALKTVARGSRMELPDGNTLRFFIWWKDGKYRTDIDLSAVGLDEHHRFKADIAYYNLTALGGCHSGDITSAPEGASEFIDIEVDKFLASGIRYVLMCINSYTHQPFYDLPECFAGFMTRQHPNSGEIYEPRTVENKIDLTAETEMAIPMIIDLQERKVIWTDISLNTFPSYANNVFNNMSRITIMSMAMTTLIKPDLYDLLELHILARGTRVKNPEEADTVFSVHKGITPFDTTQIISEFL